MRYSFLSKLDGILGGIVLGSVSGVMVANHVASRNLAPESAEIRGREEGTGAAEIVITLQNDVEVVLRETEWPHFARETSGPPAPEARTQPPTRGGGDQRTGGPENANMPQ